MKLKKCGILTQNHDERHFKMGIKMDKWSFTLTMSPMPKYTKYSVTEGHFYLEKWSFCASCDTQSKTSNCLTLNVSPASNRHVPHLIFVTSSTVKYRMTIKLGGLCLQRLIKAPETQKVKIIVSSEKPIFKYNGGRFTKRSIVQLKTINCFKHFLTTQNICIINVQNANKMSLFTNVCSSNELCSKKLDACKYLS